MERSLEERLAEHGFYLRQTGGNCTAYIRSDGYVEEMITLDGEPRAPSKLTDKIVIGTYETEAEAESVQEFFATLRQVLEALEREDSEYYLLELRLEEMSLTGERNATN